MHPSRTWYRNAIALVIVLLLANNVFATATQLQLTDEERTFIEANPEITVTNEFDWPPFDFTVSGEPAGLGIDLMELLSERIGIEFRYINGFTWDELVQMFFRGEIDLIHSLSITPQREKDALFSEPYYHSKNVIITRSDNLDVHTLEDLDGKIIALPAGWSSIEFFESYYPNVHIIEVSSSRQALEFVDQGKVVATVEQEGIARYFIKKFGFHDLKLSAWIQNDELQSTSSMHFAVLKSNPVLFGLLKKAHVTITPDEIDNIEAKWLGKQGLDIGKEDVGLTPQEKDYLMTRGSIRFSITPDHLPFEDIRGNSEYGMVSDFVDIFSDRLGIPFTLVESKDKHHSIQLLLQGESDIVPMVLGTEDQMKVLEFTSAYLEESIAIIARESLPFVTGLQDLTDERIGVTDANLLEKVVLSYPSKRFIRLTDSTEDALFKLSSGDIDALLLGIPVATHSIRQLGLTNLKVAANTPFKNSYKVAVTDPTLHSIMSKVIRSISAREIKDVYQKWVVLKFEQELNYRQLWQYGVLLFTVVGVVLYWNYRLRTLNRKIATSHQELEKASRELHILSVTDSLTGLFNRHHFEKTLESEIERARRYELDLSLIILDVDHFKHINDAHGHQVGDQVLVKIAGIITERIRKTDIAGRWGGEEFVIILPQTDLKQAVSSAEDIRAKIQALENNDALQVTASIGVATWQAEDKTSDIFLRADKALYEAKQKGRNCVVTS